MAFHLLGAGKIKFLQIMCLIGVFLVSECILKKEAVESFDTAQ